MIAARSPDLKKLAIVHENDRFSTDMATAVQAYKLTNPAAKFMVAAMWPLGYALYRRDRRRGVA